jgi:hypothetical protein
MSIKTNHAIDTHANAGFAQYAFVLVNEYHIRFWVAPHCIYWTDVNAWSIFTRAADVGNINAQIIIFHNL